MLLRSARLDLERVKKWVWPGWFCVVDTASTPLSNSAALQYLEAKRMDHAARYVINLVERTDRKKEMQAQLRMADLSADFFAAVRPADAGGFPSIGARGCFMSHLGVLRQGATTGRHVMIMEDDLDFSHSFAAQWPQVTSALESLPWSIFYPAPVIMTAPAGLSELPAEIGVQCSHAMLVHRDALRPLIEGLERILARAPGHPDGGPMHVDGAYSILRRQQPALRTYVFSPALGRQRSSRSDVADLNFYDRVPILRPAMHALRRVKRSLHS